MAEIGTDPHAEARVAVALAALAEVTDAGDVGALVDATEIEPGLVDLHFATTLPGYPGWRWTVSTGLVHGATAPTVLELTLLPGEGALLAPPWVPWTERLAEWRRSHPGDADASEPEDEADLDDGEDDEDDDLDLADDALDDDDGLPDDALDDDDGLPDDALDDDLLDDAVEDDGLDGDADEDGEQGGERAPRPGEVDRSL